MQLIKQNNFSVVTGPIQFGDDWPGVFLTVGFINHILSNINTENVTDYLDSKTNFIYKSVINGFFDDLKEVIKNSDSTEAKDDSQLTLNVLNEQANRVETDFTEINGVKGYFIRGDNAGYYHLLLSQYGIYNIHLNKLKAVLSSSMVK